MALVKRLYDPKQDGNQVEQTDIEAMRSEIEYRRLEIKAQVQRAAERDDQYSLGYDAALRWMLEVLDDDSATGTDDDDSAYGTTRQ